MNTDKIRKSLLRPILSEILVITTVPIRPAGLFHANEHEEVLRMVHRHVKLSPLLKQRHIRPGHPLNVIREGNVHFETNKKRDCKQPVVSRPGNPREPLPHRHALGLLHDVRRCRWSLPGQHKEQECCNNGNNPIDQKGTRRLDKGANSPKNPIRRGVRISPAMFPALLLIKPIP